jgi:hypothetical protein
MVIGRSSVVVCEYYVSCVPTALRVRGQGHVWSSWGGTKHDARSFLPTPPSLPMPFSDLGTYGLGVDLSLFSVCFAAFERSLLRVHQQWSFSTSFQLLQLIFNCS